MIHLFKLNLFLLLSVNCLILADPKVQDSKIQDSKISDNILIYKNMPTGKPVALLNIDEFNSFLDELKEQDQRLSIMMEMQPEQILKDSLISRERSYIIADWAKTNNVRTSKEYLEKKAKLAEHITNMLDGEAFLAAHKVDIKESDVRDYYNKNKEQMISRPGGIETIGISFADEKKALDFLQKLEKNPKADFTKLVISEKITTDLNNIEDFGAINQQSYSVDELIKKAVLDLDKFPAVKLVKVESDDTCSKDIKYWVIQAKEKREAEYMSFEEVADRIRQMLQPSKIKDMLDVVLPELANKYNIKINNQAFDKLVSKFKSNAERNFAAMQDLEVKDSKPELVTKK